LGSQALVEALKNHGFNAEIYEEPVSLEGPELKDRSEQVAVWVGSRIDPKAAIQALKLAVAQWPELKYLRLSGDAYAPDYVHDQLFLGGSSDTAKSYGLQAWSHEELLALDEEMSSGAFHSTIRAKYP